MFRCSRLLYAFWASSVWVRLSRPAHLDQFLLGLLNAFRRHRRVRPESSPLAAATFFQLCSMVSRLFGVIVGFAEDLWADGGREAPFRALNAFGVIVGFAIEIGLALRRAEPTSAQRLSASSSGSPVRVGVSRSLITEATGAQRLSASSSGSRGRSSLRHHARPTLLNAFRRHRRVRTSRAARALPTTPTAQRLSASSSGSPSCEAARRRSPDGVCRELSQRLSASSSGSPRPVPAPF